MLWTEEKPPKPISKVLKESKQPCDGKSLCRAEEISVPLAADLFSI